MATKNKATSRKSTNNRIAGEHIPGTKVVQFSIPDLHIGTLDLKLVGTSQLVTHAWDDSKKRLMLEAQQKTAKTKKEPKCPEADFLGSMHWLDGKKPSFDIDPKTRARIVDQKAVIKACKTGSFGIPTIMLKKAIVGACRFVDGIAMTEARGAIFVQGPAVYENAAWDYKEFLKIEGSAPTMREDIVRLKSGVADLRYRASFQPWHIYCRIEFNANFFIPDQVFNLIRIAGFAQGLGEFRAERGGSWGSFQPEPV